jgi:hypothetical protein
MVLWSLAVKRAWFLTKEAQRRFPKLTSLSGATLADTTSARRVRVRVAGRVVTVDPAAPDAPLDGEIDASEVHERYRARSIRRVTISSDAPADIFNPLVEIEVDSECVLATAPTAPSSVDDVREATAALFRKCTVVAAAAPAMFVPLACITFETLLDTTADPRALETLGEQYLRMLKMCLSKSPAAHEAYERRCYGISTARLRAELLETTNAAFT